MKSKTGRGSLERVRVTEVAMGDNLNARAGTPPKRDAKGVGQRVEEVFSNFIDRIFGPERVVRYRCRRPSCASLVQRMVVGSGSDQLICRWCLLSNPDQMCPMRLGGHDEEVCFSSPHTHAHTHTNTHANCTIASNRKHAIGQIISQKS